MTAMVASDDTAYDSGYAYPRTVGKLPAQEYLNAHLADLNAGSGEKFWYAVGLSDALKGYPYRGPSARTPQAPPVPTGGTGTTAPYVTPPKPGSVTGGPPVILRPAPPYIPKGQPGAVVPAPNTPPQSWPPLFEQTLSRARYIEICAFIFGRRVFYDTAVRLNRAASGGLLEIVASVGISFEILGDAPGEQNRGYRLSGPGGPIARRVAALVAAGQAEPNPRRYGLNDWVAAKTRDGLRFLTPAELEGLGLFTD